MIRIGNKSAHDELLIILILPPGTYKFIVSANNGSSDVWSEKEASLEIVVYAPFWQKWWFLSLIFAAIILLLMVIYQRRVAKFNRRRLRQDEFSRQLINAHETERNRIASDLHDGLEQIQIRFTVKNVEQAVSLFSR